MRCCTLSCTVTSFCNGGRYNELRFMRTVRPFNSPKDATGLVFIENVGRTVFRCITKKKKKMQPTNLHIRLRPEWPQCHVLCSVFWTRLQIFWVTMSLPSKRYTSTVYWGTLLFCQPLCMPSCFNSRVRTLYTISLIPFEKHHQQWGLVSAKWWHMREDKKPIYYVRDKVGSE